MATNWFLIDSAYAAGYMSVKMAEEKFVYNCPGGQRIVLAHGDLTQEAVDVIVNAANEHLAHGGGVAGVISRKGGPNIQQESNAWVSKHGTVKTGTVAITGAGKLPCKAVIHAVGPVWKGGQHREDVLLRSAVWNSLELAHQKNFASIALPAISSGIFGFPKDQCAQILIQTALDFCAKFPQSPLREIRFTLIDQPTLEVFLVEFQRRFAQ